MTTGACDTALARDLRAQWHALVRSFDHNVARPEVRQILAHASWDPSAFLDQQVGLRQGLDDLRALGLATEYGWVLCPEAYDFISEPMYQHALLSVLCGLWHASEEPLREPRFFERIVVRQPHGWLISNVRAEPVALAFPDSPIGWIQLPFAWDDLLQLSLDALLDVAGFERGHSLQALCARLATQAPERADWSRAHAVWNGLYARALLGRQGVADVEEAGAVEALCGRAPVLSPFVAHQPGVLGQDLGNSLAYLAKVFTLGHEAAHIVRTRQGLVLPDGDAREMDADRMAVGALWNHRLALRCEVRQGQDVEALWFASGMAFFFGLLVFGNLLRCVELVAQDPQAAAEAQHGRTVRRMQGWQEQVMEICEQALAQGDSAPLHSVQRQQPLLRWMVAYCNAMLDHGRAVVPVAARQADLSF